MKHSKSYAAATTLGIVIFGCYFFSTSDTVENRNTKPVTENIVVPKKKIAIADSNSFFTSQPARPQPEVVKTKQVVKDQKNEEILGFATPKERQKLKTFFNRSSRYIQKDKAQEVFDNSGIDTPENKEAAIAIAAQPYGDATDKEFALKKVLALRFMEKSKLLSSDECIASLNRNADFLETADLPKSIVAIKLDILALTKICAQKDWQGTQMVMDRVKNTETKAQMRLGFNSISGEK